MTGQRWRIGQGTATGAGAEGRAVVAVDRIRVLVPYPYDLISPAKRGGKVLAGHQCQTSQVKGHNEKVNAHTGRRHRRGR